MRTRTMKEENTKLRELNTKLIITIKFILPILRSNGYPMSADTMERIIKEIEKDNEAKEQE